MNNFFFFDLENSMGIRNPILYFTSNASLDHNSPISCLLTDCNICFSLTWQFHGASKSDIVLYLKWLTGPKKVVIMIRCKINFDMIWYSVIFAANLYLTIFVWSSDIVNFVFMNVVILFFYSLSKNNLSKNEGEKFLGMLLPKINNPKNS